MRAPWLVLTVLACASPAGAQTPPRFTPIPGADAVAHDPWIWPGAEPTPDVTLDLVAVGRDSSGGHARVRYQALALGFAADQKLVAWGFRLGAPRAQCLQSGFVVDSTGRVVCAAATRSAGDTCLACTIPLDQVVLAATGYAPGEPYRVAVISPDGKARAYAQVFPSPVESASDSLRLHLEMVSPDGLEYAVIGEGFEPGSKLGVTTRSGEISGSQKMFVPQDGRFRLEVLPQVAGEPSGFTSVTVDTGRRHLTLDWEWGRAAFKH